MNTLKAIIMIMSASVIITGCDILGIGGKNGGDISINTECLEVDAEGGPFYIQVYCDSDWSVESGDYWVNAAKDDHNENSARITVNANNMVDENGISYPRETTVTFYSGKSSAVLTVKQSAESRNTIYLTQSEANFGPEGGRVDVMVKCTDTWQLIDDGNGWWVTPSEEEGRDSRTVRFDISYNGDPESRSTTFTFWCGQAKADFTITQEGDDSEVIVFRDPYFEEALKYAGTDKNGDGQITVAEAASVTELNISGHKIRNFDEIRYFTSLVSLDCSRNNLEKFPDLSACTKLEKLDCSDSGLNSIDLSSCPGLTELNCNYNQLGTIDLSSVPHLRNIHCENCILTSLDLSVTPQIREVHAGNNSELADVNFSGCESLESVYIYNCALGELNFSGYPSLTIISASSNSLTSLICRDCPSLNQISCEDNEITTFVTENCPSLERIYAYNNQIETMDIRSDCLVQLHCESNRLTGLDLSHCPAIESLECNDNRLTALDVSGLAMLGYLDCSNNSIKELNLVNNSELHTLYCTNNGKMSVTVYRYHTIENFSHIENDSDTTVIYVDQK